MENNEKKMKVSVVDDYGVGLYVWELENGQWISDGEGHFLTMPSDRGDEYKLGIFKKYAHNLLRESGVEPNGRAVFLPGHRQITDEQYEEQKARQDAGLTPDPFDVGAAEDELRYAQRFLR
jgi:hypothetical protein